MQGFFWGGVRGRGCIYSSTYVHIYPPFVRLLPTFCPPFVHLLPTFCPPFVHLLSTFLPTFCPPFVHLLCTFCPPFYPPFVHLLSPLCLPDIHLFLRLHYIPLSLILCWRNSCMCADVHTYIHVGMDGVKLGYSIGSLDADV